MAVRVRVVMSSFLALGVCVVSPDIPRQVWNHTCPSRVFLRRRRNPASSPWWTMAGHGTSGTSGTVTRTVAGGEAMPPDPDLPEGWLLLIEGTQQSHVDLADPTRLAFEYMRRIGHVIDLLPPAPIPWCTWAAGRWPSPGTRAPPGPGPATS